MVALIIAIFSCVLTMAISIDGLMFLILPLMEKSLSIVRHLLFWSALAFSVWLAREVFYSVLKYCGAKDQTAQEGLK